jgi:Skp family chaperone for outer membrane proteins
MGALRTLAWGLALLVAAASASGAQEAGRAEVTIPSPILTLDQDRVFSGSLWGRRVSAQIAADISALAQENEAISEQLTVEERDLTERRATMSPEAFREEADAFDERVTTFRRAQDAKSRDIARRAEADQIAYYDALLPILSEVLRRRGAVAILDRAAIFLSADAIDITDDVIARADVLLGPGPIIPGAQSLPVPTPPASGN